MVTLPHSRQASGAQTPARTQELGYAVESGTEGQRWKNWKPGPGEGQMKVSFGMALLAQGLVSWATGECLWDPLIILSVIFKLL